ncbi:MAG: ABC transporter ATP-binding protein [Gammaproteobacteria bacterium]|nr:ABC transporter ATP-binding protein [Gammaproteobacteria bacterium]
MIETKVLGKSYGKKVALTGLDLSVAPGEVLGFLGPNGAGKSTTVKILTGMIKPTSGTASVAGHDVVRNPLEVKRRIGYVPEAGTLFEALTGKEYLSMVAGLKALDPTESANRIEELMDLFDIADAADSRLGEYSKGMKQKVLIGAALLGNPEVLFLDEPLNGLDTNAGAVVKQLLRELAAANRTVLFCSHILEVVERVCDRILIIDAGRRVAEGAAREIATDTGTRNLEEAFIRLTGVRETADVTRDMLAALQ